MDNIYERCLQYIVQNDKMKLLNLIFELGLPTDFRNKDCHRWGGKWILHEDITSNEGAFWKCRACHLRKNDLSSKITYLLKGTSIQ